MFEEKWKTVLFGEYDGGPHKGFKYVEFNVLGGYDKTHTMKLEPHEREFKPQVMENPADDHCVYKLLQAYQNWCHPEQKRLFCYTNNSATLQGYQYYRLKPVGHHMLCKWQKDLAESAGITGADRWTPHMNRHHCARAMAESGLPLEQICLHTRHKSVGGLKPYLHRTAITQAQTQAALLKNPQLMPDCDGNIGLIKDSEGNFCPTTKATPAPKQKPGLKQPPSYSVVKRRMSKTTTTMKSRSSRLSKNLQSYRQQNRNGQSIVRD